MNVTRKKILIIEDEYDLATMVKKYLEREHYEVQLCNGGVNSLAVFKKFQPDLLLLDLMLPDKDGLEILREVRIMSTLPVIIISAKETELDRILGLKVGADDYLTKPFSIKELLTRIEVMFRRIENYCQTPSAKKVVKYHEYVIDTVSREVKNKETMVNLTAKEYDLFLFLVEHPRQVFSKNQLYDQVWGINEYGDINTVTIHIQKLREKLGNLNKITTIRGVGYRFDGVLK